MNWASIGRLLQWLGIVRKDAMDERQPWWKRDGSFVAFPEMRQGSAPHCLFAALAGAVNYAAGSTVWKKTDDLVTAWNLTRPKPPIDFGLVDVAVRSCKQEVECEKSPLATPLIADAVRQRIENGWIALVSMQLADRSTGARQDAFHIFTLISVDPSGSFFQVWDSNGYRGYLSCREVEQGLDLPDGRPLLPHELGEALFLRGRR